MCKIGLSYSGLAAPCFWVFQNQPVFPKMVLPIFRPWLYSLPHCTLYNVHVDQALVTLHTVLSLYPSHLPPNPHLPSHLRSYLSKLCIYTATLTFFGCKTLMLSIRWEKNNITVTGIVNDATPKQYVQIPNL
jgi:hypothetical protein